MFTTIDKALVAMIMGFAALLQSSGWELPGWFTEDWTRGLVAVLTPVLVYAMPNRDKNAERRIPRANWSIATLMCAIVLVGCAGTQEAYRQAEGLSETAKVVGEHYYALVRELNRLDDEGRLSASARLHAQDLVRNTAPLVRELSRTAQAYDAAANAQTEDELARAIDQAAVAISRLVDVIKGMRSARLNNAPALQLAPA